MCKKLLISLSLLVALASDAQVKTADDFFHRGAQLYIHGKKEDSKKEIFTGLQFYPVDTKLNGMAVLLKKEEEQQKQQQQQQQQNQQDQNQQQQQQQGQKNQNRQKESQQQQQQQSKPEEKQQSQSQQQQSNQSKEQKDEKERQDEQAYAAGQMTPEQAERLLDAEKGDEKVLTLKPEGKPTNPNRPFKDW